MRLRLLMATLLTSLSLGLIGSTIAGEEEVPRPQKPRQQLIEQVHRLRNDVVELRSRVAGIERLVKTLKARPATADTRPLVSSRREKHPPRPFWEGLSDSYRERARAAEKSAPQPLREWSLSGQWKVWAVTVADDNRTVLAGGALGEWRLGDITTGRLRLAMEHPEMQQVQAVDVSLGGDELALGSATGLHLLSESNPAEERSFPVQGGVRAVRFSPDDELIAIGGRGPKVLVLQTEDLNVAYEIETRAHFVKDVRFTTDGQRITVSGGYYGNREPPDSSSRAMAPSGLWDLATGLPLFNVPDDKLGTTVLIQEIVPGRSLLVCNPSEAKIWNIRHGDCLLTIADRGDSIADVSEDRSLVLVAPDDDYLSVHDAKSGRIRKVLRIPRHWRYSACLSPNGRFVVTGGADGGIRVWEVE